jgi:hypothetical protein
MGNVAKQISIEQTTKEAMFDALEAIHAETLKLMKEDLPKPILKRVQLIHSIARYMADVRNADENATP